MRFAILLACLFMFAVPVEAAELKLTIDGAEIPVKWEDNKSVNALKTLVPLNVKMSAYGGFEQVGSLGRTLPRHDENITAWPGDIVLYSGNQIVIFHGSNTWAYTRLGSITGKSLSELKALLDKDGVKLTITAK